MKWNTLLYSLLFSGLGIFSFLLLANYTNLTPQVTNTIHTPGAFVFIVATFNILGYCTLRISSWMNRLYSNNLRWKWKFIAVYIGVMLLFLLLTSSYYPSLSNNSELSNMLPITSIQS